MNNSLIASGQLRLRRAQWLSSWRLFQITRHITAKAHVAKGQQPVVFFNASSRLTGLSLNAAFTFLTASGVQLAGAPVVNFACHSGMSRCVLGTDRDDHTQPPPCDGCITRSEGLFGHVPTEWFNFQRDKNLEQALQGLDVEALSAFEWTHDDNLGFQERIPLGQLVLPSLRWALRKHHLGDNEATRFLLREYLLSAYNLAKEFLRFLERVEPASVVVFNGIMYPEATARWVAQKKGLRVMTHEVGFRPYSAFFSDDQATAYPIHIPEDFELSNAQNARLDAYLKQRFEGNFTMAGIRFWPEMHGVSESFDQYAEKFKQIVLVFTNIAYDTSQIHANTIFPDMFAWLEVVLALIRDHPDTLFIIRAHPDEMRPGKESHESVKQWVEIKRVNQLGNVIFIEPREYLSSYELIPRAKFVMVYNSSIGLEAVLMGGAVLCGGKARYTQYPMVYFPKSAEAYKQNAEAFLSMTGKPELPEEFQKNARRFLFYQLYRASLPFDQFLEEHPRPGYVQLKSFSWRKLSAERSETMAVLVDGILHGKPFLMEGL